MEGKSQRGVKKSTEYPTAAKELNTDSVTNTEISLTAALYTTEECVSEVLRQCSYDFPIADDQRKFFFLTLKSKIEEGNIEPIMKHSDTLFYLLIDNIVKDNVKWDSKEVVLQIFREIFSNDEMKDFWHFCVELMVRVLVDAFNGGRSQVKAAAGKAILALLRAVHIESILPCLLMMIYCSEGDSLKTVLHMLAQKLAITPVEKGVSDTQLKTIVHSLCRVIKNDKAETIQSAAVECLARLRNLVGKNRFLIVDQFISPTVKKSIILFCCQSDITHFIERS